MALTMSLDQILFDVQEPRRSDLLEEYLAIHDQPVKVYLAGEQQSRAFFALGRQYHIGPEGTWVTPRTAIELLYLYGRGGVYRGFDQATGMTERDLYKVPFEEERERLAQSLRPLLGYLTTEVAPAGANEEKVEEERG
ncbi:MAG: hypothetical protein QXT91_00635 [Candidatus Caldarchaeum sp.]